MSIELTTSERIELSVLIESRIEQLNKYLADPELDGMAEYYLRDLVELNAINAKLGW
jgi:hypothetical protein